MSKTVKTNKTGKNTLATQTAKKDLVKALDKRKVKSMKLLHESFTTDLSFLDGLY